MNEQFFDDLAQKMGIDIEYDSRKEIVVIKSKIGNTVTFFGVPLSDEIRADDPEEAVKKKIRKVVGIGRDKKVRDHEIAGRIEHIPDRGRHADRTEKFSDHVPVRMDCPRNGRNRSDGRSVPDRVRVQGREKMKDPTLKDTILIMITVAAFFLAFSGAEMLTNMDPNPTAGCACLALGSTWILLICFVNSKFGREFMEDVKCLK